jgi:branched-chain amino acid transport system substrate-binding protein
MKRFLTLIIVLTAAIALVAVPAMAQQQKKAEPKAAPKKAEFKYEDPLGVVKIKKGESIHIANWMVVAGPDASLGTDTKRGVEIAFDDIGGKILGFPIKISTQDTGCNAEGGQAAATKLASDPTIVAAVGSNCSIPPIPPPT